MAVAETEEIFRLNSQRIIQIISDPAFYHQCVAYAFMQDMAHERWVQYESEVIKQKGKGCDGCDDKSHSVIDPALSTFIRHTLKLHEMGDQHLDPLREYLVDKLGYRPAGFSMYYKDDGQRRKLEF